MSADGARSLAVFIDFENLALGFQNRRDRFDIARPGAAGRKGQDRRQEGLCRLEPLRGYTAPLHEAAIELIEIPRRARPARTPPTSACASMPWTWPIPRTTSTRSSIVSGDSDFSPLVSKLKELGKHVIGLGMQESTSESAARQLRRIHLLRGPGPDSTGCRPDIESQLPEPKRKAFALLIESLLALRRENKEVLWSSMIKDTMKRKKPSFNETYHGYRTFSELLEDAAKGGPAGTGHRQAQPDLRRHAFRLRDAVAANAAACEAAGGRPAQGPAPGSACPTAGGAR